jgi:RNA-directed DNA polymerase
VFSTRELNPNEIAYLVRVRSAPGIDGERDKAAAARYAENLMTRGLPVLFDRAHLAYVTALRPSVIAWLAATPSRNYATFRMAKRSGGSREISAPRPALKHVQIWIHRHITSQLIPHQACHGFVNGRSIVTNALPHTDQDVVLKIDLLDFFPSVSKRAVFRTYRRIGYSRPVANLLTSLTTLRGGLPQGAPTSPQLANLAAYEMDVRLSAYCQSRGLVYTRYADDLTFSGSHAAHVDAKRMIETIVRGSGFRPNEVKTRYMRKSERQIVTGIVVNELANWPRNRVRRLRQEIHYLERYGLSGHLARRGIDHARYKEYIYGHVFALNSARPDKALPLLEALDRVQWPY